MGFFAGFVFRVLAVAAMLVAAGLSAPMLAAVTPSSPVHADLDLGDDDGDGIPNYLDPDDDNDGVTDETDPEPSIPAPPKEEPGRIPLPAAPTVNLPAAPTSPPTSVQPVAVAAQAPQVTTLPNTGSGPEYVNAAVTGLLVTSLAILLAAAFSARSQSRMP
jgi:hypothetical protein